MITWSAIRTAAGIQRSMSQWVTVHETSNSGTTQGRNACSCHCETVQAAASYSETQTRQCQSNLNAPQVDRNQWVLCDAALMRNAAATPLCGDSGPATALILREDAEMKRCDLTRRDFNRLTAAAFGGVMAGTLAGCSGDSDPPPAADPTPGAETDGAAPAEEGSLLLGEKHVCRGLNSCKGQGAGGDNDCAGMGACATVAAHECATTNECKGQGGCGEKPGENACKGKGSCGVPLMDKAWTKARANFEAALKEQGKEAGAAPEKA